MDLAEVLEKDWDTVRLNLKGSKFAETVRRTETQTDQNLLDNLQGLPGNLLAPHIHHDHRLVLSHEILHLGGPYHHDLDHPHSAHLAEAQARNLLALQDQEDLLLAALVPQGLLPLYSAAALQVPV
jgi:hypothetical protein